ncbi:MAG: acyl-CoA thioesterase [Pirellulaceae bacterium]|jgi:acyl-CoA thioesterase FadM|nr:acyl-CoA thioesterase [Pirellulaceae bacterium]
MGKVYEYRTTITSENTNVRGNVYALTHFKLQEAAREDWMQNCVPGSSRDLEEGMLLTTRREECKFIREIQVHDCVVVQMQFVRTRRTSAEIEFKLLNDDMEVCAEGRQTVVFRSQGRLPTGISENFLDVIEQYSDDRRAN